MKKDDPLWLCREQTKQYKKPCYREMMTALIWLADYDLPTSFKLIKKYVEEDHQPMSVNVLVDSKVRYIINDPDFADTVLVCRSLEENLRLPCITGLANGLIQFGEPEVEYVKALEFCRNKLLERKEREACFDTALEYAHQLYPYDKYKKICSGIEDEFKKYCRY